MSKIFIIAFVSVCLVVLMLSGMLLGQLLAGAC
jgi:hypothetical protein